MTLREAIRTVLAEVGKDQAQLHAQFASKYPYRPDTPEWARGVELLAAVFVQIADGSRAEEPGWEELAFHLKQDGTAAILRQFSEGLE